MTRVLARVLLAVVLIAAGAAGGVVWSERRAAAPRATGPSPSRQSTPPSSSPTSTPETVEEPVEITVTRDALARAGIKTQPVATERMSETLTVPATVASNAYRDTRVNALVGGIVRRVSAELGSPVRRGQPLAVIFSNELAEAQMKYLSMRAMLEADRQKRDRTDKLVALGAASRQELEEARAVEAARESELAAARERLLLLGLTADEVARHTDASHVVSEVAVPSPADGVVITRTVNPGQVVMAGQEMFVVTDLGSVWVIGDVYEKDFGSVRVGAPATVVIPGQPGKTLRGRIAYVDPRVDPATRTAKVRVEVANRAMELRLGMYVTLGFETRAGTPGPVVPRSAVQSVGARTVVYVSDPDNDGQFLERPVRLGRAVGGRVEVLEGVEPGEQVVVQGTFFLRAEVTRTRSGG